MFAKTLLTIALAAVFGCDGTSALASKRLRHTPASVHGASGAHAKAERAPYGDPAAPYKANRLSSFRGQSPLDVPGQTTVLTRDVLDDMNATSLRDALRSTAGVTIR